MRDSAGEDRCVTVDPGPGPEAGPDDTTLAAILREVRARTGTDFAGYRASTVRRRIMNRVISARAATLEGYLSRLRADPGEVGELLQRLTIKVSRFYRNPALVPPVVAALAERAGGCVGRAGVRRSGESRVPGHSRNRRSVPQPGAGTICVAAARPGSGAGDPSRGA